MKNQQQFKETCLLPVEKIQFSQNTIKLKDEHIKILLEIFKTKKWNEKFYIDVVRHPKDPNSYISLDNRRLFLAKFAVLKEVRAKIHSRESTQGIEQILNSRIRVQYQGRPDVLKFVDEIKTWGQLVNFRISMQSKNYKQYPLLDKECFDRLKKTGDNLNIVDDLEKVQSQPVSFDIQLSAISQEDKNDKINDDFLSDDDNWSVLKDK